MLNHVTSFVHMNCYVQLVLIVLHGCSFELLLPSSKGKQGTFVMKQNEKSISNARTLVNGFTIPKTLMFHLSFFN